MDRAQGYGTGDPAAAGAYGSGQAGPADVHGTGAPGPGAPLEAAETAVVVRSEERLRVGNALVPVERVRVRRRVVTETRTVEVQVRREELVLERLPVDAPGQSVPGAGRSDDVGPREVVLELREEVPVVTTQVRPVERVWVWVARVAGTQQVSATLRREEIAVDDGRTAQVVGNDLASGSAGAARG